MNLAESMTEKVHDLRDHMTKEELDEVELSSRIHLKIEMIKIAML